LSRVRDAKRPVHEGLKSEVWDGATDLLDVVERVLAREDDPIDAELPHYRRPARVVHCHLRRAVDLEAGVNGLDEPHQSDVLHDRSVDAAVDRVAEQQQCVGELVGFDERIQRQVDAYAAGRGERARAREVVERELSPLVARVETNGAEIHGVGAVRDGSANSVKRAGRREKLRDTARGHPTKIAPRYRCGGLEVASDGRVAVGPPREPEQKGNHHERDSDPPNGAVLDARAVGEEGDS
jgi:hypothetical protein